MPCRWSPRCQSATPQPVIDNAHDVDLDEVPVKARFAHRMGNMRQMRRQTRRVVLLMALIEALRVGPAEMVFAGKEGYKAPGEDDFGIAYWVGFMLSYVYMCIFMVVFTPLFSWWIPNLPTDDSPSGRCVSKVMDFLKSFDLFILPVGIALALAQHVYYTLQTLIHVDRAGPLFRKPANDRKTWAARLLIIAGIGFTLVFGFYAFAVLEASKLAKVKTIEYCVIVVPIQINFGCVLGGVMQWKMERRIAKKEAIKAKAAKMALEEGTADEKAPLAGLDLNALEAEFKTACTA